MTVFSKVILSVFTAIIYASASTTAPSNPLSIGLKHSTHCTRSIGKHGLTLNIFYPATTFETFGEGNVKVRGAGAAQQEDVMRYAKMKLGVDADSISFRDGHTSEAGSFAYFKQKHNGIEFANSVANVAFKDNRVVAFRSSFVKLTNIAPSEPKIALNNAITVAEDALGGEYNQHPPKLEYLAMDDGSVALVHTVQIQNEKEFAWHEVFVDAHSGEVLSVVDFVSHATYRALPINKKYPTDGFENLVNPEDPIASPKDWLDDGNNTYTITGGNNVYSAKNLSNVFVTSSQSSPNEFIYKWDPEAYPATPSNVDAARVNAFYVANTVHDIAYHYGFTERSYNFQINNFDRGGVGNDPVLISVQDPSGFNDTFFASFPDGHPGIMVLFVWNLTTPFRDSALENDIIAHEYTHGITNRLTGGGTARCLQTVESRGLSEGWSDAFADWNGQNSTTIRDFEVSAFLFTKNLRKHPYSTNRDINPLVYSNLRKKDEFHAIGEIWANMLHNMLAALVEKYGWSKTARTNAEGPEGNVKWLHLFIDALALQPCNPTFTQARDAWLQADYEP